MIIIGLMFLFLGLLCLFLVYKGVAQQRRMATIIGVYFTIFGLMLILSDMFLEDYDIFKVMGVGIGFMFICYAMNSAYGLYKCRIKVEGIYVGSQPYSGSKGITMYAPIFEFVYHGHKYQQQSFQSFSAYYIDKHFLPDEIYTLYIDEDNHHRVLVNHRIQVFDIFMFLLGMIFAVVPFTI